MPTTRRRLDPDTRRSEILDAALRLYAVHPYAAVSTGDLAREAGVARGLLNHYFGTKRELYLEALRLLTTIPDDVAIPEGPPHVRAGAAIDWFLDAITARPGLWLSAGIGGTGDPDVDAVVADADELAADRVLSTLGDTPHDEVRRARVRAYFGLVRAASREWLVRGSLDRAGVRALLVTTLVAVLETERSGARPSQQED